MTIYEQQKIDVAKTAIDTAARISAGWAQEFAAFTYAVSDIARALERIAMKYNPAPESTPQEKKESGHGAE